MRNIMALGLNLSGAPLFATMPEEDVARALIGSLDQNIGKVQDLAQITTRGMSFRGEMERLAIDPGDPQAAGWTFLVNEQDPQRPDLERLIRPLAEHRKMADPGKPLLFHGEPPEEWFSWITDNYTSLQLHGEQVPQYILILGGPEQVSFQFQSMLNTNAKVGRLCFTSDQGLDELKTYLDKLIRLETAADPVVTREVLLFAPDAGPQDPTYYSREYMAKPLGEHIQELGFPVKQLMAFDATKPKLADMLANSRPALVYTASHGMGAMDQPEEIQREYNGAICCQHAGQLTRNDLFSAQDVPLDRPFLEGAVFFQFACFGFGTPADSDFTHWLKGVPEHYTTADFMAALPQRLLAHPRGPIVYIGHLDTAFLHGFTDADQPAAVDRWNNRIAPFVSAVDKLLGVQPSGLGMQDMSGRYSFCNALITNTYDRERRGTMVWNPTSEARFLDTWITRSDAQNYMIFGDPAARLRIPSA
jgi:hypothetical protein